MSLLTEDKITEIFCAADEFCKEYAEVIKEKRILPSTEGKKKRNRSHEMSDSEIMTILMLYHFGNFKNFKSFYLLYIGGTLRKEFPK
ncbi:hypothetical protein M2138_000901, partial [Dysgonomonadaceae bacterium PH5-43]|nr:hypothetical protein [Dysgonomonadaceae bacterium PH5-43]